MFIFSSIFAKVDASTNTSDDITDGTLVQFMASLWGWGKHRMVDVRQANRRDMMKLQ